MDKALVVPTMIISVMFLVYEYSLRSCDVTHPVSSAKTNTVLCLLLFKHVSELSIILTVACLPRLQDVDNRPRYCMKLHSDHRYTSSTEAEVIVENDYTKADILNR